MSSEPNRPERNVPRRKIENAMQEVAEYRRHLYQVRQLDSEFDPELLKGFHAAIMVYFEELQPYKDEAPVEPVWDEMWMWPTWAEPQDQPEQPNQKTRISFDQAGNLHAESVEVRPAAVEQEVWVQGLDAIEDWKNRRRTVEERRPGLGRGTKTTTEPVHMSPPMLLGAAHALDTVAGQLGFNIDLPDEYREDSNPF